jgi:hypothetical protein
VVPPQAAITTVVEPAMYITQTALSAAAEFVSAADPLILAQPKSLPAVIESLKLWIMGLIAAVATLFLVIGGLRYITAGGDPAQVEQAKGNLKSALLGYALAVLAPVILQVLRGILGG